MIQNLLFNTARLISGSFGPKQGPEPKEQPEADPSKNSMPRTAEDKANHARAAEQNAQANLKKVSDPKNYLRVGSENDKNTVSHYQQRLKDLGYYKGEVNGNYTQEFAESVSSYQKAKKIHVDGIIGPETGGKVLEDTGTVKTVAEKRAATQEAYRKEFEAAAKNPAPTEFDYNAQAAGTTAGVLLTVPLQVAKTTLIDVPLAVGKFALIDAPLAVGKFAVDAVTLPFRAAGGFLKGLGSALFG